MALKLTKFIEDGSKVEKQTEEYAKTVEWPKTMKIDDRR